jgi:hypothetical protein
MKISCHAVFPLCIVLICFRADVLVAQNKSIISKFQAIADKLSNPLAKLMSVPFQNNLVWGAGPNNGSQNTLNFQPVIPVSITKNITIINRIVLPVIAQFNVTGQGESQNSLGDLQYSMFISTRRRTVWGIGPIFSLPTATNKNTGSGKFCIGPTGVLVYQGNGLTLGTLVNQFWSVGGDPDRGNQTQGYLQMFTGHSWKSGAGVSFTAELTQNWKVKRTESYINLMFTGITKFGDIPVQLQVGPRIPVTALPDIKGYFGIRAAMVFVFEK